MIIWRGKGPLVFVAALIGIFVGTFVNTFLPENTFGMILFGIITTAASALANYYITKTFVDNKTKVYIDKETGEEMVYQSKSSLFFISNKNWTYLIILFGISSIIITLTSQ